MRISGHTVLVTGGATGIGVAMAAGFLARGNQVIVCGRSAEALAEAARIHPGLHVFQCDVRRDQDLRGLVQYAADRVGGLSVLVNNAAIQLNYDVAAETTDALVEKIDAEIATNLTGLVKLTALALPLLAREPEAAVVNVSSGLALVPKKSAPVYCATKAAVHAFSKSLRWQMEDSGTPVRVFEVMPPLVDTAMTHGRGTGKLPPQAIAAALLQSMERDRFEIQVGKVRALSLLSRFVPSLAERVMRNT